MDKPAKLMAKCPKTGKFFFTGTILPPTQLTEIHLGFIGKNSAIVTCPLCWQNHDLTKFAKDDFELQAD